MSAPARIEISLEALAHNYQAIAATAVSAEVAPVVKADAYGIGANHVVPTLIDCGAKTFFVARVAEGVALRARFGKVLIIYILDGFIDEEAQAYADYDLRPVTNSLDQWGSFHRHFPTANYAIQVDIGMNRLGINIDDFNHLYSNNYTNRLNLIIGHLSHADMTDSPYNLAQLSTFNHVLQTLPHSCASLAASGGIFLGQDYHFDMVRPGISLYGGGPFGQPHPAIRPVVTLRAQILQVLALKSGDRVGYGGHFEAKDPMTVATLGIGYADGVLRSLSPHGQVFVDGHLKPILGRISMDLMGVDVSDTGAKVGDWVEIFGPNLSIDDQARHAETISYELLTRLSPRLTRNII
jgi:alanine racemase